MIKKVALFIVCIGLAYIAGLFSTDIKIQMVKAYYSDNYGDLVFKCDYAMREHFLAKQTVAKHPNEDNATKLLQAEIALLDCQDYDILRKKLMSYGLKESDLAELALLAVENKSHDIRKVVETHEIRYN